MAEGAAADSSAAGAAAAIGAVVGATMAAIGAAAGVSASSTRASAQTGQASVARHAASAPGSFLPSNQQGGPNGLPGVGGTRG